ncbi:alcohol dehydrogenase [Dendrothele bispora CBS 962.96]|uniref:Alcohol dehydrogenase n=1 Tax=Dendrothele bispora (strain CBS 962.96) TaxID=1314807 RepID=A0A4V4HG27_DENBC|nr:alcohol dehydrogenase [Dendrothele bispora CBS 962.96]
MAPVRNAKVIFNEIPTGYPEPGKTTVYDASSTIDLETVPLNGGVLVKVLYLSADPYMRGKMRDASIVSYSPAYAIGKPVYGFGVGKIVRSESEQFKAGDIVHTPLLEYAEYSIQTHLQYLDKVNPEPGLSLSVYVGALGMPGKTAYFAWKEFSKAKKGETVFVSGAAGPVGTFVLQLAKSSGLKVIGSAGTEEKVSLVKDLGADVAFNYKTTDTEEVLKSEGPIDIYWDNVGGSTLDAALGNAAFHSRFIECGMISGYNNKEGVHMKNLMNIVARRISMNGFIQSDLSSTWSTEFNRLVPKKLVSGEIKFTEDISKGLEKAGDALLEVQTGKNNGKKVVLVAED